MTNKLPYEMAGEIFYGPLMDLSDEHNGRIPHSKISALLNEAIPKLDEAECLEWFVDHYGDAACAILDNGVDEYEEEEIDFMLGEARAEANAFRKNGLDNMAERIKEHIAEVERMLE